MATRNARTTARSTRKNAKEAPARRRFIPDIEIPNAKIWGRPNFSGMERSNKGRIVNSEGNRNFCVSIPEEGVVLKDGTGAWATPEELIEMGWNVKIYTGGSENDAPSYYLPIKVNFGSFRPPVIWSVTGNKRVQVTEETVDLLDGRNFYRINLVVHPSVRQDFDTGEVWVSAYLEEGWFYVSTSSFEDAWQSEHPEEFE